MDQNSLINAWLEQTKTLEKVEKALEITKSRRSTLAKQLFEAHGKGPFEVEGKFMTIVQMDGKFYLKAAKLASDGTPAKPGPSAEELDKLVAAVTGPMAAADVAKAMGTTPGPKLSELIKFALDSGRITKTGERAQTKYLPKSS